MKKRYWLAGLALGGYLWSRLPQHPSPKSRLVEQAVRHLPIFPKRSYAESFENSLRAYELPKSARNYPYKLYRDFRDTFELIPYNDWSEYTIFYLHGGAYWAPPASFHFKWLNQVAEQLQARIILPVYPKAPAYHAQDAHRMVMERYQALLAETPAEKIILMGDSAGAGLGLALLQQLRQAKLPLPQQAIFISPWLDITMTDSLILQLQPNDPMLEADRLREQGAIYAEPLAPTDPLVSPLYGPLADLPPVTIFTGTHDILHGDALRYQEIAQRQQLPVKVLTYQDMMHVFPLLPTPEGADATEKIIQLIRQS
ncbi:esterase [Enterococcus canis]|uniref:Esterase n=1 Tax=Enterococcus canis TaxID=214095 RepID=A0A1L8REH6_9ENTE|nr:alpha/beta hydrolase [Enterococcus canis]OJG18133.1 esterase [Enterococcus canis]